MNALRVFRVDCEERGEERNRSIRDSMFRIRFAALAMTVVRSPHPLFRNPAETPLMVI